MSSFSVDVVKIRAVEPIEGADMIELAVVGDFRSVVKRGEFQPDMLAVYIPEASIVPQDLLKMIGLDGKLVGSDHNRVKAIKLRGQLSQGILLPVHCSNPLAYNGEGIHFIETPNGDVKVDLGEDVANKLNITKWEPPIPNQLAGEVYNAGQTSTLDYDIENIKKYPDIFSDGEEVQITEKLHGTLCQLICIPLSLNKVLGGQSTEERFMTVDNWVFAVASKGLGASGLCFKWNERNANNVYQRAVRKHVEQIGNLLDQHKDISGPVQIFGEVFGDGIQDLHYGMKGKFEFRVFDVHVGCRGTGQYLDDNDLDSFCLNANVPRVPILYRGPYSKQVVDQYSQHTKSVFDTNQICEGIVIKPTTERYDSSLGRVVLKSINEAYLLRKGVVTEFQ